MGLPIAQARDAQLRVIQAHARQRLRFAPGVVTLQPVAGNAVEQLLGIGRAALTQKLPEPLGLRQWHATQRHQFWIRVVATRHHDDLCAALGQFDQTFNAVAPVTDATVHRN